MKLVPLMVAAPFEDELAAVTLLKVDVAALTVWVWPPAELEVNVLAVTAPATEAVFLVKDGAEPADQTVTKPPEVVGLVVVQLRTPSVTVGACMTLLMELPKA